MPAELRYMHIAVFLWGFTGILGRAIILNEISLVFWRLVLTVLSLGAGAYFFSDRLRLRAPNLFDVDESMVDTRRLIPFLSRLLPGAILALHWICFYGSIKYANVSVALTCLATAPLMAALLEPLFFKKRMEFQEAFLGLFVILGMITIYYSHMHFSFGIVFGLVGAFLTVCVSMLNKKLVAKTAASKMIVTQMMGALLCVSICFPLYSHLFSKPFEFPNFKDAIYLLILSWVCTIATFFLWMMALKKVSAFTSNMLLALEPIYGIVLAFAFYQEYQDVSPYFYVGFAMIALAVWSHTKKIRKFSAELKE